MGSTSLSVEESQVLDRAIEQSIITENEVSTSLSIAESEALQRTPIMQNEVSSHSSCSGISLSRAIEQSISAETLPFIYYRKWK